MIRGLELSTPLLNPWGRDTSWRLSSIIHGQELNQLCLYNNNLIKTKTQNVNIWGSFWVGECSLGQADSSGTEVPVLKTLAELSLRTPSLGCSFISFIIKQQS